MRTIALLTLVAVACTDGSGPQDSGTKTRPSDPTSPLDPPETLPVVDPPSLVINEVMADNESTVNGPDGFSRPDYVEIVNVDDEEVALSRLELVSDDARWFGPADASLAPGERVLVWFDAAVGAEGYWAGAGIDRESDEITLFADGYPVDVVAIEDLVDDIALARTPDRDGDLVPTVWATPGEPNAPEPSPSLDVANELLFVTTTVHQIEFTFTPQAYNQINENSRPEVHVQVSIDGVQYEDVGLKLKGSASYQTMDGKPAFVLDLNQWVRGTRFRGQRALGLHNGVVLDPTRVRDYLTYQLARESGLMAPRIGWAEVWANDAYLGIYILQERYEEELIEDRRPGDGDLGMVFEGNEAQGGGWGGDFGGFGNTKFNMEEGPVPPPQEALASIAMVDQIVGGPASDAKVAELWNYLNKDQFLTYMAWESVVNHTDGYKAPNNWRFYVDPHTYKLEWLPAGAEWTWDFDPSVYSFGGRVASFCIENPLCKYDYSVRLLEVADLADSLDLLTQFQTLSAALDPLIQTDPRYNGAWDSVPDARASTAEHIQRNPQNCRMQVYQSFPDLMP